MSSSGRKPQVVVEVWSIPIFDDKTYFGMCAFEVTLYIDGPVGVYEGRRHFPTKGLLDAFLEGLECFIECHFDWIFRTKLSSLATNYEGQGYEENTSPSKRGRRVTFYDDGTGEDIQLPLVA